MAKVDGERLARELAEVGRLLDDDQVESVLARFTARAVETIPACDHATITVQGADGRLETVSAHHAPSVAHRLDDVEPWPGPILEVVRYREPRRVEDAQTEQRWPSFRARMEEARFRSCLALPLPANRNPHACFTLFAAKPGQFSEHNLDLAVLLALHAGSAFDNVGLYRDSVELVENLHKALASRELIGQAQGILMRHDRCDADTAFARLSKQSQANNVKVRKLADEVIDAHNGDMLEALLDRWVRSPRPAGRTGSSDGEVVDGHGVTTPAVARELPEPLHVADGSAQT